MAKLSILIPARNEMFLARTVQDILEHIEEDTEVIVGLDGAWADPPVIDHKRVTTFYSAEPLGQRAMTNQLARLSNAKYVMKVDAHCAFDQGFDRKMIEEMHDDWTMVPVMRNLHAFDWVCPQGHRRYQGPSGPCTECSLPTTRDVVWIPKISPQSKSYAFDAEPHFQYFGQFNKRPEGKGDITPSMSLQGSCFMLTRDKYWELDICDEGTFGSWGSQGIEVAVKTWLSGGSVMVNHKTWYAHMFRTQGGDFSFPYDNPHSKAVRAKHKAKDLFFENKWPKQVRPLSWLIEKFWPVEGFNTGYPWTDASFAPIKEAGERFYQERGLTKGIIYYTDNQLKVKIAKKVQDQLKTIGLPIVSTSLKPMDFGHNIVVKGQRGYATMFKQILTALEASTAAIVFFCEHDVLYHPSHFDFVPPRKDKFYYNQNFWKIWPDGFAAHWDANQVSGLCCYREHAIKYYRERLEQIEKEGFDRSYEPGGRDKKQYGVWNSPFPNYDIRHDNNLTKSHRSEGSFRDKSTCVNWKECRYNELDAWYNLDNLMVSNQWPQSPTTMDSQTTAHGT